MEQSVPDSAAIADTPILRKTQSHGRIGEAAVSAKCWMHGVPAYNTGGLRSNFAGSDLIIDTNDPKTKRLVQVKTGYSPTKDKVYLTQCKGECDLVGEKFVSDYVVFVNIEKKAGSAHSHDGSLGFEHLTFYVVPRAAANTIYRTAVQRDHAIPLRAGGVRKLANMAVTVSRELMTPYFNAWHLMRAQNENAA